MSDHIKFEVLICSVALLGVGGSLAASVDFWKLLSAALGAT